MRKKATLFMLAIFMTIACAIGFIACSVTQPATFTLRFVVDGEVYAAIDTSGEEAIRLQENPQKDGYIFDGWYWDENTWEHPLTANSLLNEKLTSDMGVYAKWVENSSPEGTLFRFELSDDETGYIVVHYFGDYSGEDQTIVVPGTYNGLPVIGIESNVF